MTEFLTRLLVQGLVALGDSRDLQIFTATNGVVLLDWTAPDHRVLTVWVHRRGVEVRIGTSVHTLVAIESVEDVDWLLGVLRRVVAGGSWFESYAVDPATGAVEVLSWRLGLGSGRSISSPATARQPSTGVRVHRPGTPWGVPAEDAEEQPS